MDYNETLKKLNELKDLLELRRKSSGAVDDMLFTKSAIAYGELEDVINTFGGVQDLQISVGHGSNIVYKNPVAAAVLSGRTHYNHDGYMHLLKIIGKVRQKAESPSVPEVDYNVTTLLQVLYRFRECCQHVRHPPENESDVQNILWIILRSHFDRLEKEDALPKFGVKSYKPDFGIPDLRVLIEVKFIGLKTKVAGIQEEILADIPGYLKSTPNYAGVVVLVYDDAQKLRDSRKFVSDLKSVEGIIDVIVVAGIGPA